MASQVKKGDGCCQVEEKGTAQALENAKKKEVKE